MEALVGVNQVGRLLKLTPSTVSKMARLGELPARKFGGAYKFNLEEIRAWLEARVTGRPEAEPEPIDVPLPDLGDADGASSEGRLLASILAEQRETRRVLVKVLNRLRQGGRR